MIPAFDPATGALPPGDHPATLEEIGGRFGFTPRRRWLLKGLRAAVAAFWTAGVEDIFIDGSFCTEKLDPGDVDGYWVEPDDGVYDRIDPYSIDFEMILVPQARKWRWRMWADHGVEFFIHPQLCWPHRRSGFRFFPAGSRRSVEGRNSDSQVEIMIKSDAQRERTAAQIEGFRQALTKVGREMTGKRTAAVRGSYEGMIRQLEEELREYDDLKSGELTLPNVERLDQIAPFVAKMRIAKGVSQTELARRLGVSKQVVSRYEETEYQTVAISRLQEILDAIGIKALVTLSA